MKGLSDLNLPRFLSPRPDESMNERERDRDRDNDVYVKL